MDRLRIQRRCAVAVIAASFVPWFFRSNVAALIARQRDVLLGRYSVEWFTTLLIVTIVLWCVAYGLAFPSKLSGRQQLFRVFAVLAALIPSLIVAEVALRVINKPRYIEEQVIERTNWPSERAEGIVRRRPPNRHYEVNYEDVPETARSYIRRPSGYPTQPVRLTTDARGFRNRVALDRADVIILGDSFAEGSRVDDTQAWPVLVAERTGLAVYNLAVSGTSPRFYRNALLDVGIKLEPRIALCMLYEGNDFQGGGDKKPATYRFRRKLKGALIRRRTKELMTRIFASINTEGHVPDAEGIAWQPAGVPDGSQANYYAFRPKRLIELYRDPDQFERSKGWQRTRETLDELIAQCRAHNIRPIFIYAPSKAHVVMPLLRHHISPQVLHAYATYRKDNLPAPPVFHSQFYDRIDSMEQVVGDYIRDQNVDFISTTSALQAKMAAGVPVYFTYDKHWSPLGHVVAADLVAGHLQEGSQDE